MARKAEEELKRLAETTKEIHLYVIDRKGGRSFVSYDFARNGDYTRKDFEVADEDAVKFAYMFFFTSVLKATGAK